ncbi:MAG: TolC family protein [Betaproteobacteria bacterium]|nr:TolC family protein [Betaproteobacteria bacterium]MDE2131187.1 TolC family protein [Betaproteobacteria bacterium]MDE2211092.1 TolC family protein [Betaproteobacteria bacterium]
MRTVPAIIAFGAWCLFSCCCVQAAAPGATPPVRLLRLSLADAKALAAQHQTTALTAREQALESQAHSSEVLAGYLPSVDFKTYQTRQTENLKAMGLNLPGFPTLIGPFDTFDARVRFTQRVFDLARLRDIDAARHAVDAARLRADAAAQQAAGAAALAYVESLRAQEAVHAAVANFDLSQSLLMLARDQQAAGLATGVDVVRAETVHARNTLLLRQSRQAASEADTRLHRALGVGMDLPLQLTDSLTEETASAPPMEPAIATALRQRPELQALEAVVVERDTEHRAALAESYPALSVAGDIGPSGVTPTHNDYRTYSFGVQLTMPLLEGGAINARQDAAASRMRQAELELRDTMQQVEEDVRLAHIALETSLDQITTAETSLTLADRLLDQARDRFKEGVADNLELVDAQATLANARSTRIDALAAHQMALINFELSIGRLEYARP